MVLLVKHFQFFLISMVDNPNQHQKVKVQAGAAAIPLVPYLADRLAQKALESL
jgi:hypothetical protein